MNSLLLLLQTISLVFAMLVVYYSFMVLNNCSNDTKWGNRLPLIITFTGACGVVLHILMGNVPHWSFTLILIAVALRMATDRRRPNPLAPRNESAVTPNIAKR